MAAEVLVEAFVEDGKRILDQLVQDGFEVTAAAWIKSSEEGLWHLYIVSPMLDPLRPGETYATTFGSLNKVEGSSVNLSDIIFIAVSHPLAREIIDIRDRYSARVPIRLIGGRFKGVSAEEARIYPRIDADDAAEALHGLIRFLKEHRQRGLGIDPSNYTRPDGQPFKDEGELIDYWTEVLGRMPLQTPAG